MKVRRSSFLHETGDADEICRENTKKMALIETLKWNAAPNVFAFRYPDCELTTKSQVVVYESQEAVFVKDGQFIEALGPGRHILDTNNFPFITKLMKDLSTGGSSPFNAEVWYVNKAIPLDIKWGTADPIQVEDPKYHVMMPVRSYGQYGMQIIDAKKFLSKLVGRVPVFVTKTLNEYFRGMIITQVKDCIATYLIEKETSVLQMGSKLADVSEYLQKKLEDEIADYGVKILSFRVNSITADEKDPAVAQLKRALAKKAEMDIVGYTYQQEKSFDVMGKAASNQGSGAGASVMQTGMGLGMGVGIGTPLGTAAGAMANNLQFVTPAKVPCTSCGMPIEASVNFCPNCGARRLQTRQCASCKEMIPNGAKFCPNCGKGV